MRMDPLIYIIENDQAMVESLSWLLESMNLKIKTYKCTQKFLIDYDKDQHGCILLNVRMPGMSGCELQEKLNNLGNNLPIIFISSHADVTVAVHAMKHGAIDFLIRPFNDKVLFECIDNALLVNKNICDRNHENREYKQRLDLLSQREKQVLQGILSNEQNKLISEKLKISLKTVEAHRSSMMKKLNVNSIVELIKLVVSKGLD